MRMSFAEYRADRPRVLKTFVLSKSHSFLTGFVTFQLLANHVHLNHVAIDAKRFFHKRTVI
jgi:hypothetical protein